MLHLSKQIQWHILLLLGLAVVITGCQKEQPDTIPESSWPSAIWYENVITFTEPAFGIQIDLPRDWEIYPRIEGPTSSSPIDAFYLPCVNPSPHIVPPCSKIQLSLGWSSIRDIDEVKKLRQDSAEASPSTVVLEERELDLNGLPALWSKSENRSVSDEPMVQVLILVDEHVVALNAYGELGALDDILSSVRSIE